MTVPSTRHRMHQPQTLHLGTVQRWPVSLFFFSLPPSVSAARCQGRPECSSLWCSQGKENIYWGCRTEWTFLVSVSAWHNTHTHRPDGQTQSSHKAFWRKKATRVFYFSLCCPEHLLDAGEWLTFNPLHPASPHQHDSHRCSFNSYNSTSWKAATRESARRRTAGDRSEKEQIGWRLQIITQTGSALQIGGGGGGVRREIILFRSWMPFCKCTQGGMGKCCWPLEVTSPIKIFFSFLLPIRCLEDPEKKKNCQLSPAMFMVMFECQPAVAESCSSA